MGWFSKKWKQIKRGAKKVFKKTTKVVKKVVKKIKKVGKKVWGGIKKGVKKIGRAINKLGPIAQMAITYFTGGLWAAYGVWGAMAKGAIMGYVTTGSLKGALVGGALGGVGYGIGQGAKAFKGGYMGESASFTDKLTAGFKAVGNSTTEGVTNMYNSASKFMESGNVSDFKYLDDSGNLLTKTVDEEVYNGAKEAQLKSETRPSQADVNVGKADYKMRMRPKIQHDIMQGAVEGGREGAIRNAQKWGYNAEVGGKFHSDLMEGYNPDGDFSVREYQQGVLDYAKAGNTGIDQATMAWEQDVGNYKDFAFDYAKNATGDWNYKGFEKDSALSMYTEAAAGGTPTYIATPDKPTKSTDPKIPKATESSLLSAFAPIKEVAPITIGEGGFSGGKGFGSGAVDAYDITKLGLTPLTQQALLAKQQMGLV